MLSHLIILVAVGSCLGATMFVSTQKAAESFVGASLQPTLGTGAISIGVVIVTSLAAGILPVRRSAAIDPWKILKD